MFTFLYVFSYASISLTPYIIRTTITNPAFLTKISNNYQQAVPSCLYSAKAVYHKLQSFRITTYYVIFADSACKKKACFVRNKPFTPFEHIYNFIIIRQPIFERQLPEPLLILRQVHGMVNMTHNQDQSCGRILQKKDLHRAHHRYLREAQS